jgi:endonuclease/exonuclease/phosphatase family metal-dependent hydrolase
MTYNVENLFDDVDNGTEFPEFDPSRGRWTAELFRLRVDTIAEVVRKAVPGGPDILMLQEVENENALRTLAGSGLKDLGYSRAVIVPKKGLAANVAVLTRLPVSRVNAFQVGRSKAGIVRDVVEVVIEKEGCTLHLLNNHWKSKTGGPQQTEDSRLEAARVVVRRVREILSLNPTADVVVAGDLNESTDEQERTGGRYQTALLSLGAQVPARYAESGIFLTGSPEEAGIAGDRLVLYDPWLELEPERRGSYFYGAAWETYDHFLLSPGLFDGQGFSCRKGSFTVFRPAFLLMDNGSPRKWSGLKGKKGYSDHLPLLITLDLSS